jgi:hypothetical protein
MDTINIGWLVQDVTLRNIAVCPADKSEVARTGREAAGISVFIWSFLDFESITFSAQNRRTISISIAKLAQLAEN